MSDVSEGSNNQTHGEDTTPTASLGAGEPGLGRQIGPYKLLSILGEGGYGIVYLAEQQKPVKRRVLARTERRHENGTEELLVVTRYQEHGGTMKYDYYLSNAFADTTLDELACVTKAEHLIEDAIKRAKSQAGLSDYETRTWSGWYHHNVLSLIATWFLACEMRRGKKIHSRRNGSSHSYALDVTSTSSL